MPQTTFAVETRGPGLTEITEQVAAWVAAAGVREGLLTLFVRHTSASLLVQENADPKVQVDLMTFFARFAPEHEPWVTHREEGPDDMPSHIKAAVLPVSLAIPVTSGRLALGTWQGIYLVEHRRAHRRREVAAHLT